MVLGLCGECYLCSVAILSEYLGISGDGKDPLFVHANGTPLTKHQFWAVTSRALGAISLSGQRFCTHSFQIGAASTAAGMGYQAQDIQRTEQWHTRVFKSYVWLIHKV